MNYEKGQFSDKQRIEIGKYLLEKHQFFYHCTAICSLDSIRKTGVDVDFSREEPRDYGEPKVRHPVLIRPCAGSNPATSQFFPLIFYYKV